jgi:hypothetical protein
MTGENLLDYRRTVFSSKLGEDGIIENIFERFDIHQCLTKIDSSKLSPRTCIDIGAHDGVFISNVRNLIVNHGWSGILIEGDPTKADKCRQSFEGFPVVTKCCYVGFRERENNYGQLFGNHSSTSFLSIDVDGIDYEIFESIPDYLKPSVVCVEVSAGINPSDHTRLPYSISKDNLGQGLGVMTDLAKAKGYELLCYTGNAFYILREHFHMFDIPDNSPEKIYSDFWSIQTASDKQYLMGWCKQNGYYNPLMI